MENFPKYYTLLFNAVTDAIGDLDSQNYGAARARLVKAQQDAEEAYLDAEDEADGSTTESKAYLVGKRSLPRCVGVTI